MTAFIKRNMAFIAVGLLVTFAIMPLFRPGFFSIHDDEQIARLYEFDQALKDGQFPPRWSKLLGFGYGYPIFIFYPPLIYYLGEIFHLLGFSLIDSTKLVIACGFLLSSIFMYLWIKERFGSLAGVLSATLYTFAPYHAVDIYVRGALSEFFSFVWIPAVLWVLDKLAKERKIIWAFVCGIFLAFVVLTHNLIALSFAPFVLLYCLFLLYENRKEYKKILLFFFFSACIALGFSAFFWLPALVEKQYTLVDEILTRELASYQLHFVYLRQLWNSPWGYGGSIYGLKDGISFEIGKLHILLSSLLFVYIVFCIIKRKINTSLYYPLFICFLFFISMFMITFYSRPVWDIVKPLWYLQFSWRYLLFTAFFSSALGGIFFHFLGKFLSKKQQMIGIAILLAVTIIPVISHFQPEKYLYYTDKDYTTNQDIEWRVSKMSFEYVPKGVKTKISDVGTTILAIEKTDIPQKSFEVLSGPLRVKEKKDLYHYKEYETNGSGILLVNTYLFPGWKVFINEAEITPRSYGQFKLISFPVTEGSNRVRVIFKNTPIRSAANIITGITSALIMVLLFTVFYYEKKKR